MGAEQRPKRRDVGDRWAGWAIAMLTQVLSDQLKPCLNQGGILCPPHYYWPPGFSDLPKALKRKEHGCVMPTPIHSKAVERFENLVGASFNNCISRYFEKEGFDSIISYSSQNLSGGIAPPAPRYWQPYTLAEGATSFSWREIHNVRRISLGIDLGTVYCVILRYTQNPFWTQSTGHCFVIRSW